MVCGPIGNGGNSKIRRVSEFLMKNGFEVADQFDSGGGDYSGIRDFAGRKALSNLIVRQDLRLVRSSDVLVVLPIPSFGAAMEMFYAKRLGKRTVLFSQGKIPSPWPVRYADYVARDRSSLLETLKKIGNGMKRQKRHK